MIEQNVLLGNGINIEFSENDDYKNFAILQRMCVNLSTPGRYIDIFNGIIDSSDMYDFMEKLNKWFKNHALKGIESLSLFENEDELRSILEMSKRYSHTDPSVIDIGLEDYLLGLKFFNAKYKEDALDFNTLYRGITMLMLDAIYNDYEFNIRSFAHLIFVVMYLWFSKRLDLKVCPVCNRYFVPSRSNNMYCDGTIPGTDRKCAKAGPQIIRNQNMPKHKYEFEKCKKSLRKYLNYIEGIDKDYVKNRIKDFNEFYTNAEME